MLALEVYSVVVCCHNKTNIFLLLVSFRTTSSVGRSKTERKRKEEKDRNNRNEVLESLSKHWFISRDLDKMLLDDRCNEL